MSKKVYIVGVFVIGLLGACAFIEDTGKVLGDLGGSIERTSQERQSKPGAQPASRSTSPSDNSSNKTQATASSNNKERSGNTKAAYSKEVLEAQKKLNNQGYKAGREDGLLGPKTRNALQLYQVKHSLKVTGKADRATMTLLRQGTNSGTSVPNQQPRVLDAEEQPQESGTMETQGAASLPPSSKTARLVSAAELRTEPDPYSKVIKVLAQGTSVEVMRKSGEWAQVGHENQQGYIFSEFLGE